MKRTVYQSVEDKYIEMEVLAIYKYIGESDKLSFINGKIYDCVGTVLGMKEMRQD